MSSSTITVTSSYQDIFLSTIDNYYSVFIQEQSGNLCRGGIVLCNEGNTVDGYSVIMTDCQGIFNVSSRLLPLNFDFEPGRTYEIRQSGGNLQIRLTSGSDISVTFLRSIAGNTGPTGPIGNTGPTGNTGESFTGPTGTNSSSIIYFNGGNAGAGTYYLQANNTTGTLNLARLVMPRSGIFGNLRVTLGAAPTATRTYTVVRNSILTSLLLTITTGAAFGSNTSTFIPFNAGDTVVIRHDGAGVGTSNVSASITAE